MGVSPGIALVEDETQVLIEWAASVSGSQETVFHKSQKLATRLGAHYRADGLTEIGFWVPALTGDVIQSERQIYLEVFTPLEPIDFQAPEQVVKLQCDRIPLPLEGEYVWGVLSGMKAGTREESGSFYWLRYYDDLLGKMHIIRDIMPASLPYGVFAPAELYDMERLQRDRADLDYFKQTGVPALRDRNPNIPVDTLIPRLPAPTNILQIHIGSASADGTIAGLTETYQRIAAKLAAKQSLTPAEENYIGYDAVQLLPIEPPIEYRLEDENHWHEFFALSPKIQKELGHGITETALSSIKVTLRKPDTENWGYDVPIVGSSAINPAQLRTLRPDELIDLIATLHNFPEGPIQAIYDLVYGHADNQCLDLLARQFLKGPNMYGQDLNHQLPMVRAILLEMQRRKLNTGADGIRVDGGQDFRFFNPLTGLVAQDDAYLLAMSDVVQEVGGYERLMFTIFEDGRPWPEEGWEESSTYMDLIKLRPDSYQWGPLIFAHNTPTLKGFWDRKWRRVCEVMYQGERWITGCGNHDTVRRGNQIAPNSENINWNLGDTLPDVLCNAYDNPATLLWVYGFSPGLPMDFLNALVGSPWGFLRNTDDRYGVKVVSEEAGFLYWQISPEIYHRKDSFPRLKSLGFQDLKQLREFVQALKVAMVETDYDLEQVAEICKHCLGGESGICEVEPLGALNRPEKPEFLANLDVLQLKAFAMAFMEDGYEVARVSHYEDEVNPDRSRFNLQLRQYRLQNPWLTSNLTQDDRFDRFSNDRRTVFYGIRTEPQLQEPGTPAKPIKKVAMVVHMGGDPATVTLADWLPIEDLAQWKITLIAPGIDVKKQLANLNAFELSDSQGVLFEWVEPVAEPESVAAKAKPAKPSKTSTTKKSTTTTTRKKPATAKKTPAKRKRTPAKKQNTTATRKTTATQKTMPKKES